MPSTSILEPAMAEPVIAVAPLATGLTVGLTDSVAESPTVVLAGCDSLPASSVAVATIKSPGVNGAEVVTTQNQLPAASVITGSLSQTTPVKLMVVPGSAVPEIGSVVSSTGFMVGADGAVVSIPPVTVVGGEVLPASSSWVAVMSSPSTGVGDKVHDHEPSS